MSAERSHELLVFDHSRPPAVIVRRRTQRLSLRLDNSGGLRINAPPYVSDAQIKRFIDDHQPWIRRQFNRTQQTFAALGGQQLAQNVAIDHRNSPALSATAEGRVLVLSHPAGWSDWAKLYETARPSIRKLLDDEASTYLLAEADSLTANQRPRPLIIRRRWMRSRWGSCTSAGAVTLNSQLLRLPRTLRHYVIWHELTHLNHPHHQSDFWRALETKIGSTHGFRRQLRSYQLWY